eukprot:TRINITY_DN12925_c0_g3_i1.p1 TRINITY_DN12925_c0_g3~~TRINITY_DN12925_c0_g3_i1.p1  ORF type:complete len:744 (+),score=86.51 TRINITY_DN12925_c0_g3_i1:112-2343(+)
MAFATLATRCFGYASDGPPFEYVKPSGPFLRGLAGLYFVFGVWWSLQTSFPVYAIVLTSVVSAIGFATQSINPKKHPFFAEIMSCIWFALAVSTGYLVAFGREPFVSRQRAAAVAQIVAKQVPSWLGLRKIPCLSFLVLSLLMDFTTGYLIMLYHGDEYTLQMAFTACLWTCLYTYSALAQIRSINRMYKIENDLKVEKTAMERLLSILCDCLVLIHANGDTVLRSNPHFDSLTGRAMEAIRMSDAAIFSAEDSERLQDAFRRAIEEPLILPISIRGISCEPDEVELLIVKRESEDTFARRNKEADRRNGSNDNALFSFLVGVRIADARRFEPVCDKDSANEARSAAIELESQEYCTDAELNACRGNASQDCVVDMAEDHNDGRSVGNSTTVTGMVFENLNTALVTGDRDSVKNCLEHITIIGRREKWFVPVSDISLLPGSILGRGGFAIVICGKIFGTDVAVKLIRTKESDVKRQLRSLPNELRILRGIHHPNVVQFFGACVDVDNVEIGIIFERVAGVCLDRFVCGSPETPENTGSRCAVTCDISGALQFLHAQKPPIVHSDLKPSNVMVESTGWEGTLRPKAKILDFGLARFAASGAKAAGGTLQWIAPEIIRDPEIVLAPSADVYSFGHIILFLNTGKKPREDVSREEIVYRAKLNVQDELVWPDGVQPFATNSQQLVADCVSIDAHLRPPMEQVHVDILSWKTYHTTKQSPSHKEATWIEGLEIVRARTTAGTSKKCL